MNPSAFILQEQSIELQVLLRKSLNHRKCFNHKNNSWSCKMKIYTYSPGSLVDICFVDVYLLMVGSNYPRGKRIIMYNNIR